MGKIAIYPGSFNPWHEGHKDVLYKACQVFEKVIVAKGINPFKDDYIFHPDGNYSHNKAFTDEISCPYAEGWLFTGLLKDFAKKMGAVAIIKGLRNSEDLEYEKTQQYWNEDLGLEIPTFYVITDRKYSHISSSAIRAIKKIKSKR